MIAFHFPELHIRDIFSWKNCNIKTKKCRNTKKCINLRSSGGPKVTYLFGSESFKIVFFWVCPMFRCSTLFFLMWWCTLGWTPFWKRIHIFHAFGILWIFLLYSYCKAISVLKQHFYFVVILLIFWISTGFFKFCEQQQNKHAFLKLIYFYHALLFCLVKIKVCTQWI